MCREFLKTAAVVIGTWSQELACVLPPSIVLLESRVHRKAASAVFSQRSEFDDSALVGFLR